MTMSLITRRYLLTSAGLVTVAVVGAAGVGSAVAALISLPTRTTQASGDAMATPPAVPPAELTAALVRERQLLATIDLAIAAAAANDPSRAVLLEVQADHR